MALRTCCECMTHLSLLDSYNYKHDNHGLSFASPNKVNYGQGGYMFKNLLLPAMLLGLIALTACSTHKKEVKESAANETTLATPVTQDGVTKMTSTWPEASRSAISAMTAKYGLPSAVTDDMVVWNSTAPFKRSIVFREEVNHQFPIEHSDVLMQTIDYRVPLDKFSQLSKFDGSLIIDRTKGELSARNDKEEMNILSLNLADKIVRGEMSSEQARREFTKNAETFAAGSSSLLVSALTFSTRGNTMDPDVPMQSQKEGQPSVKKSYHSKEVKQVIEDTE